MAAITAPSTTGALQIDDAASPLLRQHLDGHFAVGLGPAEVDQDGDAGLRPGAARSPRGSPSTSVPSPPPGVAAAPGERHVRRRPSGAPCRRRPRATSGECETMTMPTLPLMLRLQHVADRSDHERAGARAGIHVADASARRGRTRGRGWPASAWSPFGGIVPAPADARASPPARAPPAPGPARRAWSSVPTSDLPRAFTAAIAAAKAAARCRRASAAPAVTCRAA